MVKKIVCGLLVTFFVYVGVNVVIGRMWYIQDISVGNRVVVVDWDKNYQSSYCGGAPSCSQEQRNAVTRVLMLNPFFWTHTITFHVEGVLQKYYDA